MKKFFYLSLEKEGKNFFLCLVFIFLLSFIQTLPLPSFLPRINFLLIFLIFVSFQFSDLPFFLLSLLSGLLQDWFSLSFFYATVHLSLFSLLLIFLRKKIFISEKFYFLWFFLLVGEIIFSLQRNFLPSIFLENLFFDFIFLNLIILIINRLKLINNQ